MVEDWLHFTLLFFHLLLTGLNIFLYIKGLDTNDISTASNQNSTKFNNISNNNNIDYSTTNNNSSKLKNELNSTTGKVRFLPVRALFKLFCVGALVTLDRRDPEGRDNDSTLDNSILEIDSKEKTYTTDVNGKVI